MAITSDEVNLAVGFSSILLAVLAVILSIWFFIESKKSEQETKVSLKGVQDTTKTLDRLSMRLINRLTSAIISPRLSDDKMLEAIKSIVPRGFLESSDETNSSPTKVQLEQFRVDNLIAAYYYCSLTNLSNQSLLPSTIGETETDPSIANVVDGSKSDFEVLERWINNTDDIQNKISNSPVANLYGLVQGWKANVVSVREVYASRETEATPSS